jgi:hypothetical protein
MAHVGPSPNLDFAVLHAALFLRVKFYFIHGSEVSRCTMLRGFPASPPPCTNATVPASLVTCAGYAKWSATGGISIRGLRALRKCSCSR